jgi:NAD(P)-dependent dehydrogenase (short-subunit alcohol dehydrogenase family)
MPLNFISRIFFDGFSSVPYSSTILKVAFSIALIYLIKLYSSGARNSSERVLHGKVAIITGGTSGVGAAIARELASRGAQLILLTRHPLSDPFLVDYIEDLRTATGNELITVEQVDLADLLSIRKFATQWIDNTPPRRLDMLILCGDEYTPKGAKVIMSKDMAERMIAVNYLANFHLVSILSPSIRAQPVERDVRVLVGMCASYMGGDLDKIIPKSQNEDSKGSSKKGKKPKSMVQNSMDSEVVQSVNSRPPPSSTYATSKLALFTFCSALQKHFSSTPAADGFPPNRRVLCVDPGWTRTPGMRRYLTGSSLWGLLLYVLTYPLWWLVLKSPEQGAQSFLWAAMDAQFSRGDATDCTLIKECRVMQPMRQEVTNEETQKKLWEETDNVIKALEKRSALKRAQEKKDSVDDDKPSTEKSQTPRQSGSRKSRKVDASKT